MLDTNKLKGMTMDQLLVVLEGQQEEIAAKDKRIFELEKVREAKKVIPEFLVFFSEAIRLPVRDIEKDLLACLVEGVSEKKVKRTVTSDGVTSEVEVTEKVYPRWKSLTFGDIRLMVGMDVKKVEKAYLASIAKVELELGVESKVENVGPIRKKAVLAYS